MRCLVTTLGKLRMAQIYGSMRYNGTLQILEVTGENGVDGYGEPIAAQTAWGDPIPCSVRTSSDTRKGKYEDGEYRHSSFIVLIEWRDGFSADRIRLERLGEVLGEFRVLSVEPLSTVGRIQIMV